MNAWCCSLASGCGPAQLRQAALRVALSSDSEASYRRNMDQLAQEALLDPALGGKKPKRSRKDRLAARLAEIAEEETHTTAKAAASPAAVAVSAGSGAGGVGGSKAAQTAVGGEVTPASTAQAGLNAETGIGVGIDAEAAAEAQTESEDGPVSATAIDDVAKSDATSHAQAMMGTEASDTADAGAGDVDIAAAAKSAATPAAAEAANAGRGASGQLRAVGNDTAGPHHAAPVAYCTGGTGGRVGGSLTPSSAPAAEAAGAHTAAGVGAGGGMSPADQADAADPNTSTEPSNQALAGGEEVEDSDTSTSKAVDTRIFSSATADRDPFRLGEIALHGELRNPVPLAKVQSVCTCAPSIFTSPVLR